MSLYVHRTFKNKMQELKARNLHREVEGELAFIWTAWPLWHVDTMTGSTC